MKTASVVPSPAPSHVASSTAGHDAPKKEQAAVREVEGWGGFVREAEASHTHAPITRLNNTNSTGFMRYVQLVSGTMPELETWLKGHNHRMLSFVSDMLRGISQVFLINNPISGLVMAVGLGWGSWWQLVMGLLALASATLTAHALGFPTDARRSGLFGYNGILVGMALALFHFGSDDDVGDIMPQLVVPVIIYGAFSTVATEAIGRITVSLFGLAPFTFPFQVVTWLWLLASQSQFTTIPLKFPAPGLAAMATDPLDLADGLQYTYSALLLWEGVLKGVAQVFLIENVTTGVVILVAIAISSPIASGFVFLGAFVSTGLGVVHGVEPDGLYAGLYGYNAALTSLCVGGLFYVPCGRTFGLSLFATAVTLTASAGISAALRPIGMPALTFPFCLVTWLFLLIGPALKGVVPLDLAAVTTPENHLARYRVSRMVSNSFAKICAGLPQLVINGPEDLARIERELIPLLACSAAAEGDVAELQGLAGGAAQGATMLSNADYDGRTPLMLAAAEGQTNVVSQLLQIGVTVDMCDRYQGNALEDAVRAKSLQIVQMLVGHGLSLNPASVKIVPAVEMCSAAWGGDIQSIEVLMAARVSPESADYDGRTALHLACCGNHVAIVRALIDAKAPLSCTDRYGNTPLSEAKTNEHTELASLLVQQGAKESSGVALQIPARGDRAKQTSDNDSKATPHSQKAAGPTLHNAVQLTTIDADENSPLTGQAKQKTALELKLVPMLLCSAASTNDVAALSGLIGGDGDAKAAVNVADYDGRTPLMLACAEGHLESIELLLNNGADPNAVDRWGSSPLWEGVANNSEIVVKTLLRNGARLMMPKERVASHICIFVEGNTISQLTRLLQVPGVDPNSSDYDLRTPLHVAVEEGRVDITRALLDARANPAAADRWGHTPASIAGAETPGIAELLAVHAKAN